jgi:hypothetical protein
VLGQRAGTEKGTDRYFLGTHRSLSPFAVHKRADVRTKNENVMTQNADELVKALTAADKNCHAEGKEGDARHSNRFEEAGEEFELTENWDAVASTPIASSAVAFARDGSVPVTTRFRVQCTWQRMS